jgi:hypothetical protein
MNPTRRRGRMTMHRAPRHPAVLVLGTPFSREPRATRPRPPRLRLEVHSLSLLATRCRLPDWFVGIAESQSRPGGGPSDSGTKSVWLAPWPMQYCTADCLRDVQYAASAGVYTTVRTGGYSSIRTSTVLSPSMPPRKNIDPSSILLTTLVL